MATAKRAKPGPVAGKLTKEQKRHQPPSKKSQGARAPAMAIKTPPPATGPKLP
jgi:hypothetical protein